MTKKKAQTQPTVLSKSRSAPQHAAKRVVGPRKAVANFSKGFNQSSQRTEAAVTDGASEATVSDTVDIDEIFNSARKRPKSASAAQEVQPKKARRVEGSKDDIFALGQPKARRYDPEGLPVYSPEELNVGAGGETEQCPFDCTCCF